jgi:addiction module HigA family antidote
MRTKSPSSTTTSRARRSARRVPLSHPGEILLEEFLAPAGISQYALAKAISVPPRRINEIVHGLRGISADTALRLGRYFGMEPEFWMNLQSHYDMEVAKDTLAGRLEREVSVRAKAV